MTSGFDIEALRAATPGCATSVHFNHAGASLIYYFGDALPPELCWERPVGTHQVGFHDQRGPARNKPTLSKKEANATPVEFRDALIAMARLASPLRRVAA